MADEAGGIRAMTVLSLVALVTIVLGIASYLLNVEQNRCEMTYMYEMPDYIPVPLTASGKEESTSLHQRYKLFVYGEGLYAEQLKSELRYGKLTGVPVLFIPGSSGSHAQMRSLASVLLRKADTLRSKVQFNVFAVDFGADFSALDGALLSKQSDFVVRCLRRISHLYPQRTENGEGAGIIVYGHSMGGVVGIMAAKALESKGRPDTMAPLLLTYASPFARPVAYFDPYLEEIYNTLFTGLPKNLFLLSVGGGFRDQLVSSQLTVANLSQSLISGFMTNTMSMPLTWASADHRCIVWCRQVVLATARAIFELVDAKTKRMTVDTTSLSTVVRKHFAPRTQLPHLDDFAAETAPKSEGARDDLLSQGSSTVTAAKGHTVPLIVPSRGGNNEALLIIMHNWAGKVVLTISENADSPTTELEADSSLLLPPLYSSKQLAVFRVKPESLDGQQVNVVFQSAKSSSSSSYKLVWSVELVDSKSGSVFQATFPTMGSAIRSFFAPTTIAYGITNKLFTQVILNAFDSPYSAATIRLLPLNCRPASKLASTPLNGSLVVFHNVDNVDEAYEYAQNGLPISLTLRKQVATPLVSSSLPRVSFVLDPACTYEIDIKWSLSDGSAQYIRFVGHLFPSTLALVLISFMMASLRNVDQPITKNMMQFIFFECKPVSIVAVSKLLHLILGRFAHLIPVPFDFDVITAEGDNVMFGALPLMLYFFVLGFIGLYVQLLVVLFRVVGRPFSTISSWLLRPSLYLALVLQLSGCVLAATLSSALGLGMVYLSFLIPLFCLSSAGINWQLQRFVLSLALFSLWFALLAGPTLVHQFYLPASDGFSLKNYKPVFAANDGSTRFDLWLQPGAICLALGSMLFTTNIIFRLRQASQGEASVAATSSAPATDAAAADQPEDKSKLVAPRFLQFGAIGTCLFASRSLHRASTIAGVCFLLAALCHFLIEYRNSRKTPKKDQRLKAE